MLKWHKTPILTIVFFSEGKKMKMKKKIPINALVCKKFSKIRNPV
jgi:hypothetical protein